MRFESTGELTNKWMKVQDDRQDTVRGIAAKLETGIGDVPMRRKPEESEDSFDARKRLFFRKAKVMAERAAVKEAVQQPGEVRWKVKPEPVAVSSGMPAAPSPGSIHKAS